MNETAENPTKMLLHACCGPCSLEPSRLLREEGYRVSVFFANSNIHPAEEYARRLETLRSWAEGDGLAVIEGAYDAASWEATAGRIGDEALREARSLREKEGTPNPKGTRRPDACADACTASAGDAQGASSPRALVLDIDPQKRQARCRACYRLRFEEAARYAAARGFAALGTTLSVSPYQYTDIIREELERAAAQAGIRPVFRDFRPYYDEATRRSRNLGMYRQNYCGCRFSMQEAEAERQERKAARRAQREADAAAHAQERAAAEAARSANRAEKQAYAEKQARKRALLKQLRGR